VVQHDACYFPVSVSSYYGQSLFPMLYAHGFQDRIISNTSEWGCMLQAKIKSFRPAKMQYSVHNYSSRMDMVKF